MSNDTQPRHSDGRWAETVLADPGSSILDGIAAPVADRILTDAVQAVRGGDTAVFAGVLQTLAGTGEFGPNISIGHSSSTVRIQIVSTDGRGRYELVSPFIPDAGTGIEALRAYSDEARSLLDTVQPIAVAMAAADQARLDTGRPAVVDAAADPATITWNGGRYLRCDEPADAPTSSYGFLLRTGQPMSDEQMGHLAQLAGYAWAASVHGESLPAPQRVDDRTLYLFADSTKGRGSLDDFVDVLPVTVHDGSPVRTTDRAGTGTAGTRLVEGLPGLGGYVLYFEE